MTTIVGLSSTALYWESAKGSIVRLRHGGVAVSLIMSLSAVSVALPSNATPPNEPFFIDQEFFDDTGSMDLQQITDFLEVRAAAGDSSIPTQAVIPSLSEAAACAPLDLTGEHSAADVIAMTARACGVNPQILLALPESDPVDSGSEEWPAELYGRADRLLQARILDAASEVAADTSCMASKANAATRAVVSFFGGCGTPALQEFQANLLRWFPPTVPEEAPPPPTPTEATAPQRTQADTPGPSTAGPSTAATLPMAPASASAVASVKVPGTALITPLDDTVKATWKKTKIATGWTGMVIAAGDLNNDGFADLLRRDSGGKLWFYPGKTNNTFAAKRQVGSGWNTMDKVVGGVDWNKDGNLDLIARQKSSGKLFLHQGKGNGKFKAKVQITTGWTKFRDFTAAASPLGIGLYALNGDTMYFYGARGTVGITSRKKVSSGWNAYNKIVAVGDWTGDGRSDLLARKQDGALYRFSGTKKGTFGKSVKVGASGWNSMTNLGASEQRTPYAVMWVTRKDGTLYAYQYFGGQIALPSMVTKTGNKYSFNLPWYGQQNNYYCGAATGQMILKKMGWTKSLSGVALSQKALARNSYMATDKYERTAWKHNKFAVGMNNWRGINDYKQLAKPSTSQFRTKVAESFTVTGRPIAVDMQEYAGGRHVNNHPNRTFSHILAITAYDPKQDMIWINDPGAKVLWPQSAKTFRHSIKTFATFLTPFGIYY